MPSNDAKAKKYTQPKIESDGFIIEDDFIYSEDMLKEYRQVFEDLKNDGKITGEFDGKKWMISTGKNWVGVDFEINEMKYKKNMEPVLLCSVNKLVKVLKCYVLYLYGSFIAAFLSETVRVIIRFAENNIVQGIYEDCEYILYDFLLFFGMDNRDANKIIASARKDKRNQRNARKLKPAINYLAINNEISRIYESGIDEATFIRWFPVFFWIKITFILPLRATEMLLTPFNCIAREGDDVFLTVRRTKLKGSGAKTVGYEVEKDYKEHRYRVPDDSTIKVIEKYIEITGDQKRAYLFKYDDNMTNKMVSLRSFNYLLNKFIGEHLIGNPYYDYTRYATGIKEFEYLTAGDSRHIAMSNLYFSDMGADICRQLAGHINVDTSAGYYTNSSEIIFSSSVMQLQKQIGFERRKYKEKGEVKALENTRSLCTNPKRKEDPHNIEDCMALGQMEECIGCPYYLPTKRELDQYLFREKDKTDESSKMLIEKMNEISSLKDKEVSVQELFLKAQRDAKKYEIGSMLKAKELKREWEENKSTKTGY